MHPCPRPLRRAALAAVAVTLALAAPAAASGGDYTTILCGNPDTWLGSTTSDGAFPDGVRMSADNPNMTTLESRQQCSSYVHGGRGMLITTNGNYHLQQLKGATFTYELPADLQFLGATIYGRTNTTNGMIAKVVRTSDDWIYASPSYYGCEQPAGCNGTGTGTDPYGAANRIEIGTKQSGMEHGFKWFLRCAWHGCDVTTDNGFVVYGGKVRVGDSAAPSGSVVGGGLASATTLKGKVSLTFNAADGQSGVYRARAVVDGTPQPWTVVDAGRVSCRDVNFENGDAYEFNLRRPCPASASGELELDTRTLAEGERDVRVVVEDAAGNQTALLRRTVTVDNVAPPRALEAARVRGTLRKGSTLAITPGLWENGGAAGEPALTYQWERCNGTGCTPISGATDELYEPTSADIAQRLRVVETATNSEGAVKEPSGITDTVRDVDGSLPIGHDGRDNDCDGQVDEAGEGATCPPPADPPGDGGKAPSDDDAKPLPPSTSTTTTTHTSTSTSRSVTVNRNGDGASPNARLSAAFGRTGHGRVDFGRSITAGGRLVDAGGRPITGATIEVFETAARTGAKTTPIGTVVTGADGTFRRTFTGAGGTRGITFAYRYEAGGAVVARRDLDLTVRARVQLSVKLRGVVATYRGRVLAGAMPKGGKLVIVQGRAKGGQWQTFASRRADKRGVFRGRYRLKVRRPGKQLQFRVRVLAEAGWNYVGVTSRPVSRRVR